MALPAAAKVPESWTMRVTGLELKLVVNPEDWGR